jgi:hypothetical protein
MSPIRGSAIQFSLEASEYSGTSAYLTISDPDGIEVLSETAMSYTTSPSIAFTKIWQSSDSNTIGKYIALFKTVNGIYSNYAKHNFFLEAKQ